MRRFLFASTLIVAAATAGCNLSDGGNQRLLVVEPVLDSMFVGETRPARNVYLIDANGNRSDPGTVTWEINPDTVATIDAVTGTITGVDKGEALVFAHAAGVTSLALIIVSRPLDMTLLMDTVYLMPGDTFTIPLAIQKRDPLTPDTVWFDPSPDPARYTIDTASGLVTAVQGGNPVRYTAHVATATDTVTDTTGAVRVTTPTATGDGRFFATVLGTAIRHKGGAAYAMNYAKRNGHHAFRLTDSLFARFSSSLPDSTLYERLMITLPDSVIRTLTTRIEPISPQEADAVSAGTLDAICDPPRTWGLWLSIPQGFSPLPPRIRAFSQPRTTGTDSTGYISITKYQAVSDGVVIGGRFLFTAQREDLYFDPLGIVTIRGTFVAPLVEDNTTCLQ